MPQNPAPLSRLLRGLPILVAMTLPGAARAAPQTSTYEVDHAVFGNIGTYTHTSSDTDGGLRAEARLNIVVKVLGVALRRETSSQVAVWRGQRLVSIQSTVTTNGRQTRVSGVADGDRFVVTTSAGTANAPADAMISDPFTLNRMGPGAVVSTLTGKVWTVQVTGGEIEPIAVRGVTQSAKHFHVNAPGQANKWEVWIDARGVPVKFRSQESGGAIDFNLMSGPN
jgi:hypothetical protein